MARPATGQTPPISFRPPKQLLKDFDATIEEGRSRSDVLIELMHERVSRKRRERRKPAETYKPIPPGARWPSRWDYDPRGIDGGDPDTACGDAYRTGYQGVARCLRGQGHPGIHNGPAEDGTSFQWDERPVGSEEKTT